MTNSSALVIAGNGGIGFGIVENLVALNQYSKIFVTYRDTNNSAKLFALEDRHKSILKSCKVDATVESDYENLLEIINASQSDLTFVANCVGILQVSNEDFPDLKPEKSLSQINPEYLSQYFLVNSIAPILAAKKLQSQFKHKKPSKFITISAKVGSIGDNYLGGWYGYRASKAALNMFIKTASLEYKRRSPNTVLALLHPGTTDTRLSEPFQKNVKPEKLFTVERCVKQLMEVTDSLGIEDSGKFFSWDGSELPW